MLMSGSALYGPITTLLVTSDGGFLMYKNEEERDSVCSFLLYADVFMNYHWVGVFFFSFTRSAKMGVSLTYSFFFCCP
jgi:hypothetical protein